MSRVLPTTIPEYLRQLRAELAGADPAMIHDALYDAEEYLRSELAENPGKSEAEVIAAVASSYGAPAEVAEIYRDTEVKVQTALAPPSRPAQRSLLGRFFGVLVDPHTYGALFYMALALITGIFYFSWTVTGLSLSLSLVVIFIGIPIFILFIGCTRVLALMEGRIVEVMLGQRMPRRPAYTDSSKPWTTRIAHMLGDARTWTTLLYFVLMLPLGVVYFTVATTLLAMALALILVPIGYMLRIPASLPWDSMQFAMIDNQTVYYYSDIQPWAWPLIMLAGFVLFLLSMHLARAIGRGHGLLAKHLLVPSRD